MSGVQLVQGDITTAPADAIVNAANSALQRGGGVCGAIHRAAGPALQAACDQVPRAEGVRCPVGEARITAAGNLPARYVIHAVGDSREPSKIPDDDGDGTQPALRRISSSRFPSLLHIIKQYD